MFSWEYEKEIKANFEERLGLLEERACQLQREAQDSEVLRLCRLRLEDKRREMNEALETCDEDTAWTLRYLWAAMPLSDLLDYPAELFKAYGEHGIFLWHKGPFAGKVPERIFAEYVLYHRVNDEDLADTRGFFYRMLEGRISEQNWEHGSDHEAENGMARAALEVNYWCAEAASYEASDERTQNPLTLYGGGRGRCGEESTLVVTALCSVGIPARQVYAPLWSHCDDNHAWVEVWCQGEWHFLGACEPEERLDLGWFNQAASRAMRVRSKNLKEEQNHLARYAPVLTLTVKAVDEAGKPVPGARVDFQVLNQGSFGKIATLWTDGEKGTVRFVTGRGDLLVSASAFRKIMASSGNGAASLGDQATLTGEWLYGEKLVSLAQESEGSETVCEIVLGRASERKDALLKTENQIFREFTFHAPEGFDKSAGKEWPEEELPEGELLEGELPEEGERCKDRHLLKSEQHKEQGLREEKEAKRRRDQRIQEAARRREERLGNYEACWRDAEVLGLFDGERRKRLEEILRESAANYREILDYLEKPLGFAPEWKLCVLETLAKKDYRDVTEEVLEECSELARPYEGQVPEKIFFPYLVCPRVRHEMLRPCRKELLRLLPPEEILRIRRSPACLPGLSRRWIRSLPEEEYGELVTSPLGCLRGGMGSELSRKTFCVILYRALGIPARLRSLDLRVEYFQEGRFWSADEEAELDMAHLVLQGSSSLELRDWEIYSLERFLGKEYGRLDLREEIQEQKKSLERPEILDLALPAGLYRLITSCRQPDGNQLAQRWDFFLEKGETKRLTLTRRKKEKTEEMIFQEVPDIALLDGKGESHTLSELASGKGVLLLWLEEGREPTEHLLNELYDKRADYEKIGEALCLVLSRPKKHGQTLGRLLQALPSCRLLLGNAETEGRLAKGLGQEAGKLPLALFLQEDGRCAYVHAGYQVGLAELLWRAGESLRKG